MENNHALSEILSIPPYSLGREEKREILTASLVELTRHHYRKCVPYHRILDALSFDLSGIKNYCDIPFLPVRLFKEFELL
ncbi:MAG: acyl-protein synthetase, partial [bacterium]